MSLTDLKKQREALIDKMTEINERCVTEVREMTTEEETEVRSLESQLEKLNNDIKTVKEEIRNQSTEIKDELKGDKEKMNQETEIRAIEQYLRGRDGEELRAVTANKSADAGAIKPDYIQNEIVKRLEEVAPLFAKATRYQTVAGTLAIPQEDAGNLFDYGFVGEDAEVSSKALGFKNVKLTQHRVGACVKLTQHLINDSVIDIVSYTVDLLARRLGATLDKEMVTGDGTGEHFKGLASATDVKTVTATALSVDVLLDAIHGLHPSMLAGAEFVMSRNDYNAVSKLKDASGQLVLMPTRDVINNQPAYRIFGVPVSVSDACTDGTFHLVNVREAFACMIKQSAQLIRVTADSTNALNGTQLFVMDIYADTVVKNNQVIVKGEISAE